jgi:Trypsin-like peptidase domain
LAGVELERVAEIIVEASGRRWRGSGYEVAAGRVLTAAHVVAEVSSARVRFNADQPDERYIDAVVSFANRRADVAILTIPPDHSADELEAAVFGRIYQQADVADCVAVGFPRFKLRDDPHYPGRPASRYRDSHQANGSVAPFAGIREGTFEFNVLAPEREVDPARSPWEGMSGAALWCGGRIVGLISLHHRREGLNRLAATRVSQWYALLPDHELRRLRELTGLPARATDLTTVNGRSEAVPDLPQSGPPINAGVVYNNSTINAAKFIGGNSYEGRS